MSLQSVRPHFPGAQGSWLDWFALPRPTRKGKGFVQPLQPHEHSHIDFLMSTWVAPFAISVRCWMALRAPSWPGTSAPKCARPMPRKLSKGHGKPSRLPGLGSLAITGPSSSPKTSRSLSVFGRAPTSCARPITLRAMVN
jgi:hypothetical protein